MKTNKMLASAIAAFVLPGADMALETKESLGR
jgi:hypothetical protein